MPGCLDGVRVNGNTALVGDANHVLNRLDGADLVVGVHDADQCGLAGDLTLELIEV